MDKQQKIILGAVGALTLAVAIVLIAVAVAPIRPVRGDFTPPEFDGAAIVGAPDASLASQYGKMTVSEGFEFCMSASPTLTGNDLALYFASPETNTVWMLLRVYDESGNLLGESGLVRPGEYLPSLTLTAVPTGETVRASVLSYEADTYYSMGSANAMLQLQVAP